MLGSLLVGCGPCPCSVTPAGCVESPRPASPESPAPAATEAPAEPVPSRAPAPAPAPEVSAAEAIHAAVASPDRSADDRALDAGRKPEATFSFFGVRPGMRVAELGAGRGYTAELLARVVGPGGTVYAQNSRFILQRFAEAPWSERLQKPALANVVRVDREFDDPLPPEAKNLDLVMCILFYHDTVWFKTDRAAMNRAVFRALKPGGVYAIVDHSAREGAGTSVAQTLHRIEETTLKKEVEQAGFVLEAEGDFLKNPDDPRDWSASPGAAGARRGQSDRFALRFKKP